MGRFVKGDVIVVPFPFSDLSQTKRRPALVLAALDGDDIIVCQITSQARRDQYAIPVTASDFADGHLRHDSQVRTNRIFTADSRIALYQVGRLREVTVSVIVARVVQILNAGT